MKIHNQFEKKPAEEGLSEQVRRGLEHFIGHHRGTSLYESERDFINKLSIRLFKSRTKRSKEIESPQYDNLIRFLTTPKEQGGVFNNPNIFGVDCIDGRVLPVYVAGIVAQFGGMIRVPAGDLSEFENKDGKTILNPKSNFAKRLDEAFTRRNIKHVTQIYDSHLHCAAREKEEDKAGRHPSDHGLYADVVRKKAMAEASVDYAETKNGKRKITPIQLSFNPKTGYIYMGLETDVALAKAEQNGGLFFDYRQKELPGEIKKLKDKLKIEPEETARLKELEKLVGKTIDFDSLDDLANHDQILSNEKLSQDPAIRTILESNKVNIDWEQHYARTAIDFWGKVSELQKTDLFRVIKTKLARIYRDIPADIEGIKRIEDMSTLALANLCNTYWLTRGGKRPFPDNEHHEEVGVVSEGGYEPFAEIRSFGINILDEENLAENTRLAYNIIIKNRKEGKIKTNENAPIIMMVQHTVREKSGDKIWKELKDKDKQDLLKALPDVPMGKKKNWLEMNDSEFKNCLRSNFGIRNLDLIEEINELRRKIMVFYKDNGPKDDVGKKEDQKVGPLRKLFPQYKDKKDTRPSLILVPVLVDKSRGIQAVLSLMSNN